MSPSFIQRAFALCLSAVLTVAMLGSIDHLSQPEEGAPAWAQKNAVAAPRA
jgi:hypothetical protein